RAWSREPPMGSRGEQVSQVSPADDRDRDSEPGRDSGRRRDRTWPSRRAAEPGAEAGQRDRDQGAVPEDLRAAYRAGIGAEAAALQPVAPAQRVGGGCGERREAGNRQPVTDGGGPRYRQRDSS